MAIGYNEVRVGVDVGAIRENYGLLRERGGALMPVVKADAYGHGLEEAADELVRAGAGVLGVGSVGEAAGLRAHGCPVEIVSLLGPQAGVDFDLLERERIIPFIYRFDQLRELARRPGTRFALKFDTGMSRLGFTLEDIPKVLEMVEGMGKERAVMVSSHLATADMPREREFVLEQGAVFGGIVDELRRAGLVFQANLANSAAILAYPELGFDLRRPGIALYGANPFHGTDWADKGAGLKPAMRVSAPVVQVRPLARGRSISYGRTFTAPRDMVAAVVAVGYADAYSRGLSWPGDSPSGARMLVRGREARVLGRVCMQMTAVDVTDIPGVAPGDRAVILGRDGSGEIRPEDLAAWWGTIPYEVFCLLGLNPRSYDPLG